MQTQNRIVLPAMDMNVSEHGEIEQSEIDHYAARAKGGAGLIITGACAIDFPYGAAPMRDLGCQMTSSFPASKHLPMRSTPLDPTSASGQRTTERLRA